MLQSDWTDNIQFAGATNQKHEGQFQKLTLLNIVFSSYTLNDPVFWNCSHLKNSCRPARELRWLLSITGV